MSNSTIEQDLLIVGMKLQELAKAQKKTMRQIATDTKLSVNSVKVVFSGKVGNISTYDVVARYLGTSFVDVVVVCYPSAPAPVAAVPATQPA